MFALTNQQTTDEQWKAVPGYEGIYEVSDFGRVRKLITRQGRPPGLLKPTGRGGYLFVQLNRNRQARAWFVHRIVLTAFVGPRPPTIHGAHINAVRDDNRLVNLHWCTPKQNEADKQPLGLDPLGERNAMAKVNADTVRAIRREYIPRSRTRCCQGLANRYGICQQSVWNIVTRKTWKHVA
jgi:hypothetical protein